MTLDWRKLDLRKFVTTFVLLGCGAGYAWQQGATAPRHAGEEQEFRTAQNRWMKVPIDVRAQRNTATEAERLARDNYWDDLIGASMPLSQPNARAKGMPLANPPINSPEYGDLGKGVWVIGKFVTYRTILSASQRSVYTEIDLHVQHVFGRPSVPGLREGVVIQIDRPGGTILSPWGSTISYAVQPEQYDFQPGHTYLVQLGFHADGNFYTGGYRTGKRWDLTDGLVRPNTQALVHRAAHNSSELNGLKVHDAIQHLDKKFAEYYGKER
jgi:hypothetical protein